MVQGRVRIRVATLRDLPILVQHRRAMWQAIHAFPKDALDDGDKVYRKWLGKRLRTGVAAAFVAETGNHVPIGSGAVFLRDNDPVPGGVSTIPHIISMFTEKAWRGRGVATRILEELTAWSKERGFPGVTLTPAPKARPLYRRAGFRRGWQMVMPFEVAAVPRFRSRRP